MMIVMQFLPTLIVEQPRTLLELLQQNTTAGMLTTTGTH